MRNNEDRFNPAMQAPQQAAGGMHYVVPTELVELPSKGMFYPPNHPLHEKEFVEIKHMTTKEEDFEKTEAWAKWAVDNKCRRSTRCCSGASRRTSFQCQILYLTTSTSLSVLPALHV